MNDENMSNQEDGVSLAEIWSWIWNKKILGLIVFVVLAIVSFLVILFISNKKTVYVVNFDYGTTPNFSSGTYLDGEVFNYLKIVEEANLTRVKESDEQFSNLDVKDLVKGISITTTNLYDENTSSDVLRDTYYTITVDAGLFSDEDEAKNYLIALINLPLEKNSVFLTNLSFEANYQYITNAKTYEEQITYLKDQVNLLNNGYNDLLNKFDDINIYMQNDQDNLVISDTNVNTYKLSQLKQNLNTGLNDYNYDNLEYIVEANSFVKLDKDGSTSYYDNLYPQRLAALNTQKSVLEARKTSLDTQINSIISGESNNIIIDTSSLQSLFDERNSIASELVELNRQICNIDKVQTHITTEKEKTEGGFADDIAFGKNLDSLFEFIKGQTITYTSVYKELYNRLLQVNYREANVITTDGDISLIINIGISVILGLVVGAIVAGIAGYNSMKKKDEELKENKA